MVTTLKLKNHCNYVYERWSFVLLILIEKVIITENFICNCNCFDFRTYYIFLAQFQRFQSVTNGHRSDTTVNLTRPITAQQ